MAKTFAVLKMIQDGDKRGRPDIEQEVSFVHLSSDGLPDGYMAYKLSGPDEVIAAVEANAKCMAAERINAPTAEKELDAKEVFTVAISDDKVTQEKVDVYLLKQKQTILTKTDTLRDMVRKFEPQIDRNWGSDIEDKYAA